MAKKDKEKKNVTDKSAHRFDPEQFIVQPGSKFRLADCDPGFTDGLKNKKAGKQALSEDVSKLADAQEILWANGTESVLIIFQALDAAGKDGSIKHVMSGVNPQGVDVHSFLAPSAEELRHHFLWRPMQKLPSRGRIAIFNRSYYEEVLIARVHPEFLDRQVIRSRLRNGPLEKIWKVRYDEINNFEAQLADIDVTVIKFFLNVSKEEQRLRLLSRLNEPGKLWKFDEGDLRERGHWDEYQECYQDLLVATSTPEAPWYVIPADNKWYARAAIADTISRRIHDLELTPPQPTPEQIAGVDSYRKALEG